MKNESMRKKQWRFLVAWSILNLVGWVIGMYFVFKIADNLETIKHLAWKYNLANDFRKEWTGETALVWFPLGLSVGILQWVKLRRLRINPFAWIFATIVGCSVLVMFYSWVEKLDSFEYRVKYDIPYWIINVGLTTTILLGGAIVGGLQSIVIRKHILRLGSWIRAYIIGLLVPIIVVPLTFLAKSLLLKFIYFFDFLDILVFMRWDLFFWSLIVIAAMSTSILTGNILLRQSNIDSATIEAG